MNFPVTYSNETTATLTATLNGTGVAVKEQVILSPGSLAFADVGVGTTSPVSQVILTNTGNEPVTVGSLSGVNTVVGTTATGEFSTELQYQQSADRCSNASLAPGSNCSVSMTFTPTAAGTRTGSITFPVTYQDHHTASLNLSLTGSALSAVKQLQIYPASIRFRDAVQNAPSEIVESSVSITNTGNAPVTIGSDAISTNSADFQIDSDTCAATTLAAGMNCSVIVRFNPAASSTGSRTGVLTIADNAPAGPHKIALSGVAITTSQELVFSQNAVNFGNQNAGTTSEAQIIYVTVQGPLAPVFTSVVLGGANPADFQMNNGCYEYSGACNISVTFSPQAGVIGTRTATITEYDSAPGSPRVITLSGIAVSH